MSLNSPQAIENHIRETVGLARDMDFRVTQARAGFAEIEVGFQDHMTRLGGTISGPVIMTAVDSAMYAAVMATSEHGRYGVTSHLSIDFLRRPAATGLIVRSRILRLGRKSANFAVEVFSQSDPDRLVAHASGAYALFESAAPEAG